MPPWQQTSQHAAFCVAASSEEVEPLLAALAQPLQAGFQDEPWGERSLQTPLSASTGQCQTYWTVQSQTQVSQTGRTPHLTGGLQGPGTNK